MTKIGIKLLELFSLNRRLALIKTIEVFQEKWTALNRDISDLHMKSIHIAQSPVISFFFFFHCKKDTKGFKFTSLII